MKYLITIVTLSFCISAFTQGPPPPAAIADSSNMTIILEVAESCHYELFYEHFKDSLISVYAIKYEWSSKKIAKVKKELEYNPPNENSYFNAYSSDSKEELENIKTFNLTLSKEQLKNLKSHVNGIIIHNMINSLKWDCKKYVR
jgi:hypothetical protein